jgi:Holliday junction resolvase-like predicted endonuclease
MANKSKAKGTRAETAVARYLVAHGWEAKRKALSGSKDCGDLAVLAPTGLNWMTIEVKAGKQTANPSRSQIDEWLRQAWVEAQNSGEKLAILVIVRYRRQLKDADVYIQYHDGDGYFTRSHCFLDEYVNGYEIKDK